MRAKYSNTGAREGQSYETTTAWSLECEMADGLRPQSRTEGEEFCLSSNSLILCSLGPHPLLGMSISVSVQPFLKHTHRLAPRCVSMVNLNPVKWIEKISHYSVAVPPHFVSDMTDPLL